MESVNFDELRKPWESDEMWMVRRAFLERHWTDNSMTKNRLICLSQIFVNLEFLDCKYDDSLMVKVLAMGDGLLEERHERRRAIVGQLLEKNEDKEPSKKKPKVEQVDKQRGGRRSASGADISVMVTTTHPVCAIKLKMVQALKAELLVMQQQRLPDDPLGVLNQACVRAKCNWTMQFGNESRSCFLKIDDVTVVEMAYWGAQNCSRLDACRRTLDVLQRPFFDVREVAGKVAGPAADIEMELYTRKDARADWESPSTSRFEPLDRAFVGLRKRLVAMPAGTRVKTPEECLREAAKYEDLPVDMKREHLGGWKEEIAITVGKVELYRCQGRMPPKGKEKESAGECFLKTIETILKPSFSDGIFVNDEKGVWAIGTATKSSTTSKAPQQHSSASQASDPAKKEWALKSVRLHLNATEESTNAIQRIEQACAKAKVGYEVKLNETSPFTATVYVDGIRIGQAQDTNKKGAKTKACAATIQLLLQPYVRIQEEGEEVTLVTSQEPFDN